MSTGALVAIIVVVVIVAAVLIGVMAAARRRRLQQRFGPEYDRVVGERQSQLKAESELASRERRVRELDIRPLSESARANYAAQWRTIQEQFVDQPEDAVIKAQHLVTVVMNDRGYPTDGHDQMLADLSVEHAGTLEHYRSAYAISQGAAEGNASTEDLRQAMIRYRTLFSDLLGDPAAQEAGIRGASGGPPPAAASATNPDITDSAAGRTDTGRMAADPGPAAVPAPAAPITDAAPAAESVPVADAAPAREPVAATDAAPAREPVPVTDPVPPADAAPVTDPASAENSASELRGEPASRTRRR
jgi:hypothetical protein